MQTKTISAQPLNLDWHALYKLTKPKVVALIVITALVGACLASPALPKWSLLLWANMGIALMAAGAAAFNHWFDSRIDAQMARTQKRPLPQGRISNTVALSWASLLALAGFSVLFFKVNTLTAWLTFASLIGYALIYTVFLKYATPQNIVIGGLAGALPPLLGWVAVSNEVSAEALLLVMIIFIWTPPHFWALAIARRQDYAKADIPMLPVTHGVRFTKLQILLYSLLLFAVCAMPYAIGMSGELYALGSALLNARFLHLSWRLWRDSQHRSAMALFKYSILFLLGLFVLLLVDHYLLS